MFAGEGDREPGCRSDCMIKDNRNGTKGRYTGMNRRTMKKLAGMLAMAVALGGCSSGPADIPETTQAAETEASVHRQHNTKLFFSGFSSVRQPS